MPDDATAADWLRKATPTDELAVFARFMAFHRVAAADPFAPDADPARAVEIRIGYGSGEQLAAGEWTDAKTVALPELPRPETPLAAPPGGPSGGPVVGPRRGSGVRGVDPPRAG